MKKLYTLLLMGFSAATFAQVPVITAVVDGPCTGGFPKIMEIYASGTVDFTQFTVQNQTNANTTWGTNQDLSALGSRTNSFVYVILTGGNTAIATAEFPNITAANSIESGTVNLNGDDRLRIINTATSAVIDQFGVDGVDGTGTTWEWLDSYAKRNNGTVPTGTFVESDWTFGGVDVLDNTGACTGNAALNTVFSLGSYTLSNKEFAIPGLKVYPNPVTGGKFFITSDANTTKSVAIFDVLGKQVVNTTATESVNVSNLKAGVYIVKITEEGKTATRKLVIK